jgi:hypothetical protein
MKYARAIKSKQVTVNLMVYQFDWNKMAQQYEVEYGEIFDRIKDF